MPWHILESSTTATAKASLPPHGLELSAICSAATLLQAAGACVSTMRVELMIHLCTLHIPFADTALSARSPPAAVRDACRPHQPAGGVLQGGAGPDTHGALHDLALLRQHGTAGRCPRQPGGRRREGQAEAHAAGQLDGVAHRARHQLCAGAARAAHPVHQRDQCEWEGPQQSFEWCARDKCFSSLLDLCWPWPDCPVAHAVLHVICIQWCPAC